MVDYSRKDVILVKDLGIIDGSRKGLYECNICGDHVIKFTANANKGSCRCQQCSKLKPLEGLPLQLVEDLGMVFINEHSSRKTRMCVVTCPICDDNYTASANDVKSGKYLRSVESVRCHYQDGQTVSGRLEVRVQVTLIVIKYTW